MTTAVSTKPLAPHGTYARYVGRHDSRIPGCRCPECITAGRHYQNRRVLLNTTGRNLTIDATPAADHLRYLLAHGATWPALIARGIQSRTISGLLFNRQTTIRRTTAQRILNLRPIDVAGPHALMPAYGATRRLRALLAEGHIAHVLAERSSVDGSLISGLINGHVTRIRAHIYESIATVYDELSATRGPSRRNRLRGQREGWRTPQQWHPDDLDVPEADLEPSDVDPIAVQRVVDGGTAELNRAERVAAAQVFHAVQGLSLEETGRRLNVTGRTVLRWKQAGWKVAA
jgi:hypothetical protein